MLLPILIYASSDAGKSSFCKQSKAQKLSTVFPSSFDIQMRKAEFGNEQPPRLITKFSHDNITSSFQENFPDAVFKLLDHLNEIIGRLLQLNFVVVCYRNFHGTILVCINQPHSVRVIEETRVINCRLFWSQLLGEKNPFLVNLNNHNNLVDANNISRSGYIWSCL
jgi:hypothetical protein